MKRILKILLPDKNKIVLVSFLLLISVLTSLALPTFLARIIDQGINKLDMGYIIRYSLYMLVLAIIGAVTMIISVKILADVSASFSKRLRVMTFEKINTLSYAKVNEIGTGSLITRSTEDAWIVEQVSYGIMRSLITIPVSIIGGSILAFLKDWSLAIIMFSCVPILVVVLYIVAKRTMPLWVLSDKYIDLQNATIKERLTGIRVIRAFNREDRECEKAQKATKIMAENIIKGNVHIGIITPLSIMLLNLIVVFILYVGAMKMDRLDTVLSAGDILAVIEYVAIAMIGIINVTFSIAMFPHAQVSYKRISEVLDSESIPEPTDLEEPAFKGNIKFQGVGFLYKDALDPAVEGLELEIKEGEKVAFIGGTGAGKSTIVNLLMGFYPRSMGEIFYDDIPMKKISVQRVRKNISCVLQKPTIFEGTIKSNIELGKTDASDEDIMNACDIAQLKGFVLEQKEGLNYGVQPSGANLSGGQKQRISVARALLKDAPIYLFDDSFSALDFLTESKIRIKLSTLLQGKTQIYITQRVASAMSSDRIYVMDKGKIVASGKHKELLSSCKIYKEIYNSQTGGTENGK